ncbi:hypothetical protein AB0L63_08655 [Nocardia sp. NPDC051990]|uniref:hypothetical protein n=1 Tax=Nocardia sp. NPDC051990 TaxID=3155285 RepID=UPI003443C9B7
MGGEFVDIQGHCPMKLLHQLRRYGVLNPIGRIVAAFAAFLVFALVIAWVSDRQFDSDAADSAATTAWTAPAEPTPTRTFAPPPPGFPRMEFPPPMPEVPKGSPQPVPTRFGLTYNVPSNERWMATNDAVMGWSDNSGIVATYGAVSEYRRNYCAEVKGSALAHVGVTGRNAVDIDSAARDEVAKAERIFGGKTGRIPKVELRGPVPLDVSGRPAVRYTALVTDIPKDTSCDPDQAQFDIVATPGYASAEVMLLMVEHHRGLPNALPGNEVEAIIGSLRKTE